MSDVIVAMVNDVLVYYVCVTKDPVFVASTPEELGSNAYRRYGRNHLIMNRCKRRKLEASSDPQAASGSNAEPETNRDLKAESVAMRVARRVEGNTLKMQWKV